MLLNITEPSLGCDDTHNAAGGCRRSMAGRFETEKYRKPLILFLNLFS
jgi:hypothetical protein